MNEDHSLTVTPNLRAKQRVTARLKGTRTSAQFIELQQAFLEGLQAFRTPGQGRQRDADGVVGAAVLDGRFKAVGKNGGVSAERGTGATERTGQGASSKVRSGTV